MAPNARITYNGFEFNPHTHYEVTEQYEYDGPEMTVVGTRFFIRVRTILSPEPVGSFSHTGSAVYAGGDVLDARRKLSKSGGVLEFLHEGFSGPTYIRVNAEPYSGSIPKIMDINGGPKPRVLSWRPIGNTAAIEIEWQCETTIPICDGTETPRHTGVKAFSYGIQYDIDPSGYTTRRISGYIEIAMTRDGRDIPDTVDTYRNLVRFEKPANFTREVSWTVSPDKRRAEFSITDREIRTNNVFPPHVINISAQHKVGWSRNDRVKVPNTISATIELSPLVPRVTAYEIFRSLLATRLAFAATIESNTFIESISLEESIFENRFTFSCSYYTLFKAPGATSALPFIILATGIMSPYIPNEWTVWDDSVKKLAPLQGLDALEPPGREYGLANLVHNPIADRITDLCDSGQAPYHNSEGAYIGNIGAAPSVFCNSIPPAAQSWLQFEARFIYREGARTSASVTLGPDDLTHGAFDPASPTANLSDVADIGIERFVEQYAGDMEIVWQGYAERIGYPIPKPGTLTIADGVELVPTSEGRFTQQYVGMYFCQPRYKAYWSIPYKLKYRPANVSGDDAQVLEQYGPEGPGDPEDPMPAEPEDDPPEEEEGD